MDVLAILVSLAATTTNAYLAYAKAKGLSEEQAYVRLNEVLEKVKKRDMNDLHAVVGEG